MKTSFKTTKTIMIVILLASCFTFAQESSTTDYKPNLPARPEKLSDEPDASYNNRLRQWEAEVRHLTEETNRQDVSSVLSIPDRPVRRTGESEAAFNNRMRQWEAQARSMAETNPPNSTRTISSSNFPDRPTKRNGESDAAYQNRLRAWEAKVRQINSEQMVQKKDEELQKLQQELARLNTQLLRSSRQDIVTNASPENPVVIPTGEIETEKLLSINEDMKIMSRILLKELLNQEIILPASSTTALSGIFSTNYETNSGITNNMVNSMYLQGYGALFQLKADFAFSLSTPPETQKQKEPTDKEEVDDVWEQTKQQLLESSQPTSTENISRIRESTEIAPYYPEEVEKLKTSFIQTLKYASNIRALQPEESVILRISERSPYRSSISAILGDQYFIQGKWVKKEEMSDSTKLLPTFIVIRAKKSDIDAFTKGKLEFTQFREKVQVLSYPVLNKNFETNK